MPAAFSNSLPEATGRQSGKFALAGLPHSEFWNVTFVRGCLSGDGNLRGAGQSRYEAMRCNARVAFVLAH